MAPELDRARIAGIVQAIADQLPGDWLLIGGALVSLWIEPRRVTEDIDVVGFEGTGADRLALLGLATDLGLPVEALNSAADFFVHRIDDWRDQVEPFRVGAKGRIFRPTPTLFLHLKVGRLSEQDLADCQALVLAASAHSWPIDQARVLAVLDALSATADPALLERRARLRQIIATRP